MIDIEPFEQSESSRMSFDLDGKAAIVTGGATLIGDTVVAELVRAGAKVVSADINREEGQRRADEYGGRVVFSATDVTVDPQLEDLVLLCVDRDHEPLSLSRLQRQLARRDKFPVNFDVQVRLHGIRADRVDLHERLEASTFQWQSS